jgi:hypothetical protein
VRYFPVSEDIDHVTFSNLLLIEREISQLEILTIPWIMQFDTYHVLTLRLLKLLLHAEPYCMHCYRLFTEIN